MFASKGSNLYRINSETNDVHRFDVDADGDRALGLVSAKNDTLLWIFQSAFSL